MSQRRFHIAAIAAAALSASFAAVAAAGPWGLAPGEYYTELRGSFFSTSSYYAQNGHRTHLGGLFEQRGLSSTTELGWKKRWSVQMSLPALSNTVRSNSGASLTSSGFGDFGFGLRCQIENDEFAKALQLSWQGPAGYNRQLAPGLGDGLQKLSATLQIGGPVGTFGLWQLGGGLRYRYDSMSGLWDAVTLPAAHWMWPDHITTNGALGLWLGRVQVAGLFATELSSYTEENPERVTTVIVGPRLAYRVDDRLDWIAGSWHTPSGRNSLHSDVFYTGVGWRSSKLGRQQGILGSEPHP